MQEIGIADEVTRNRNIQKIIEDFGRRKIPNQNKSEVKKQRNKRARK